MITLPPPFVAIQYPGYFWNVNDKQLYSLKVAGVLRPLKQIGKSFYNDQEAGYDISHLGKKYYVRVSDLNMLKLVDSVIPVQGIPQKQPVYTVPTYRTRRADQYCNGRHVRH